MLYHLLLNQPQVFGQILRNTPVWVWGLLAVLTWAGLSQARARTASLARIVVMPVAMTALSIWGVTSAFGASPMFGYVMLMWMVIAATTFALIASMSPPAGAQYDGATRTYSLPGSWVPMALILGIFLVRYWVNVEIAIQPQLKGDGQYTLVVGALYGFLSGIFAGRAARLVKLAVRGSSTPVIA